MDTTSPTLLRRVMNPHDRSAWSEFAKLYRPILFRFAKSRGLRDADAEDIVQDCMQKLLSVMRSFNYRASKGKFKNFLFTMVTNRIRNEQRKQRPNPDESVIRHAEAVAPSDEEAEWDRIWRKRHFEYCFDRVAQQFRSQSVVAAFQLYALDDRPVEEVCRVLNVKPDYVYNAKRRVIERLRREWTECIGDTE